MDIGTALSLLPNQYPAKFSFSTTTASCNDFVVYPTGVGSTTATVIAFDNMYGSTTCPSAPATGPSTYWAYNTGGTAVLSPVISGDGSQIAYIQTSSSVASLVLLKWANSGGTANSPASITLQTNSGYRNCTAPCYTTIDLSGNPNDLNSAPFPDYDSDSMYVGDNSGHLHKFTGVFSGTPAEVIGASWPIAVSANVLTSPVYDSGSGNVFVADSGGYLYSFNASSAAKVMQSSQLATASGSVGIVDSPLVDSTTGEVYVFVGDDANTNTAAGAGCQNATGCSGVFQFSSGNTTVATAGTACVAASASAWTVPAGDTINCGVESVFGSGTSTTPAIYDGAFDAIYLAGAGTTGNLWTCSANGGEPRLSYTPLQASGSIVPAGDVIGIASTAIGSLTTAAAACSSVTEFYGSNGGTDDYIFASVTAHGGAGAGCDGSCLYNFIVSTDGVTESTPSTAAASIAAAGGTSGIIVDNDLPTADGESQIYYTTLSTQSCMNNGVATTGNCAVQASPVTLTATTTGLAEGFVGTAYSVQLTNIGGVSPIAWALTSGTLPAGLSLRSDGLIHGTPTSAVSATPLVFKVTDIESNASSTGILDLTIAATAFSASASSCALTGTQYVAYAGCTIAGAGGTPPYSYSFDTSPSSGYAPVPPGLTLNPSTGAITGTNYGEGAYTTHFIATDSLGAIATVDVPFSLAGNNTTGFPLFPTDSAFHIKVTDLPVDTSWVAQIDAFGDATIKPFFGALPNIYQPNGIPFLVVPNNQPTLPVTTDVYSAFFGTFSGGDPDTCTGPCPATAPIPSYAPIEGYANSGPLQDTDMHVLVVQEPGGGNPASLWEMWIGVYSGGSSPLWTDGGNALWPNIGSTGAGAYQMVPEGVGTSDAAGLPIAPLLLTADEVIGTGTPTSPNGVVQHPVRFTLDSTLGYYVWPATHQAGGGFCFGGYEDQNAMISQLDPPTSCTYDSPSLIPMGEIYRLKASVPTPACATTSPQAAVIIQGLRDYGMILADNGASAALIGTPDSRWSDADLNCLTSLTFGQFEPVQVQPLAADLSLVESGTGAIVTSCPSGQTCYNLPVTTYRTTTSTQSATPVSSPKKAPPVKRKP